MNITIDPGAEKWLPWAKKQLAALRNRRVQLDLPLMTRPLSPEAGVIVWLSTSRWAEWIRITGGLGGYYWATLIENPCDCAADSQTNDVLIDYTSMSGTPGTDLSLAATFTQVQVLNNEVIWTGTALDGTYVETTESSTVPGDPDPPPEYATEDGVILDGAFISLVDLGTAFSATVTYYNTDQGLTFDPPLDLGGGPQSDWTWAELEAATGVTWVYAPTGTEIVPGGPPGPGVTSTVFTQTYVNWYDGSQVVDGYVTTTTTPPDAPVVDDHRTYRSIAVAFGGYPAGNDAGCYAPVTVAITNTSGVTGNATYEFTYYMGDVVYAVTTGSFLFFTSGPDDFVTFSGDMPYASIGAFNSNPASPGTPSLLGTITPGTYGPAVSGDYGVAIGGPSASAAGATAESAAQETTRAAACLTSARARLTASLATDPLARDTFWNASDDQIYDPAVVSALAVDTYAIEYRLVSTQEWTTFPAEAVDRARVATGHTEKVLPAVSGTLEARKYAGREVAVSTYPVTLVYVARDPALSDPAADQQAAFLAQVEAAGTVDDLSDADRIKSMFFDVPEELQSVL